MKTETQKQVIDRLQAELDKLKVLAEGEQKFEVGKWYTLCDTKHKFFGLITEINGNRFYYTGFNYDGMWRNKDWYVFNDVSLINRMIPATDTEVLEALTNEAERRGFNKGVRFKSACTGREYVCNANYRLTRNNIFADTNNGCIFDMDTCKWATIIEEEKIYIGENEVVIENHNWCKIGDSSFSRTCINYLLPSNPSLFGKILKRMEGNNE